MHRTRLPVVEIKCADDCADEGHDHDGPFMMSAKDMDEEQPRTPSLTPPHTTTHQPKEL